MREKDKTLYMDIACRVSKQSTAVRLKVGAVFVNSDGVMLIGYNGTPSGYDNVCENKIYIMPDTPLCGNEIYDENVGRYYTLETKAEVLHAETNALSKALQAGISTKNGNMFITHAPCMHCATLLFQAGIKNVFYRSIYRSNDGINFLKGLVNVELFDQREVCNL